MAALTKTKTFLCEKRDFIKKNKKKFFWAWITYQAVKGTLTTSFIWAPMIYYWFHHVNP